MLLISVRAGLEAEMRRIEQTQKTVQPANRKYHSLRAALGSFFVLFFELLFSFLSLLKIQPNRLLLTAKQLT